MIKILLLTDFSSGYGRSLLENVVRYAREVGPWAFYRMPLYFRELYGDEGVVEWAKKWGADAIIAQFTDIDLSVLNQLNIPIIVQNYKERSPGISNLTGDYFGTGVMAANFFLHKGYKSFAYYGLMDTVWGRERGEGFKKAVTGKGYQVYDFDNRKQIQSEKWNFDVEQVSKWLLSLPKPIALFACDDHYALQITEVCKMYDINIPEDIAVLGVDNDKLLCNISAHNYHLLNWILRMEDMRLANYSTSSLRKRSFRPSILSSNLYELFPVPQPNVLPYPINTSDRYCTISTITTKIPCQ
ncbi:Xylose operon regulatory protein [Parabacteroides sp. ASF519]|uniref:XylR family transcriptional regulator n=1 Tax=Parabacteroides sp. ASF519 TaxID=1235803 RepID=UPI00202CE788|nr:XylR family transcriptional regulator [Parabacteroides sp. ASF519]KAI4358116.1 Xylose operon regulatory protein [Parabacteroides sp. ASF519]